MSVPAADRPGRTAGWLRLLEFLRFGAVGASSTMIYLGVYGAAILAGVPFALAALAAFVISAVWGYLLHDRWTFRTHTPTRGGLVRWLILQSAVVALDIAALWALVTQAVAGPFLAQVDLLPLLPLKTYRLSRRRVFGVQ